MDIRFTLEGVAHVPVYYWPWVWWQLFWLRAWAAAARREVLYEIAPNGRVHVVLLSDDPRDLRSWLQQQAGAPRAHLVYCDNADGAVDTPDIALLMTAALEATGHLIRYVWVRIVLRPVPPFLDSG